MYGRKGTALTSYFRARVLKRLQWEQWWGGKNPTSACTCAFSYSLRTVPCLSLQSLQQLGSAWTGAVLTSRPSLPFSKALKLQLEWNTVGLGSSQQAGIHPAYRNLSVSDLEGGGGKESTFLRDWLTAACYVLLANCPAAVSYRSNKAGH